MEVTGTTQVAGSRFLRLFERSFSHKGHTGKWMFASRDENPPTHEEKRPDAVVIIPILLGGDEPKVVLTNEYRIPILAREISFPAGLIDAADYEEGDNVQSAVLKAAVRECWEETNLKFEAVVLSPPNLYASAGMTNESACLVLGTATGEPSNKNCEKGEDIEIIPMNLSEIRALLAGKGPYYNCALSVRAWMMLQPIAEHGWPEWVK